MLALPEQFYRRYASDIASRMQANSSIAEFIGSRLIPMATGVVLLLSSDLTLLYSPWLVLLVLSTTASMLLLCRPIDAKRCQFEPAERWCQRGCRGREYDA